MVNVLILGCGGSAGVPMIGREDGSDGHWGRCDPQQPKNRRTRSSAIVEKDGFRLLIDPGPDLRQQFLREKLSYVDAIVCSHEHSDHVSGIDDLRAVNRNLRKTIPFYADAETIRMLKIRYPYVFHVEPDGGKFPRPSLKDIPLKAYTPAKIGPFEVTIFPQIHGSGVSWGILIDNLAYCTDVASFPEESLKILEKADNLILGCFQPTEHFSHASVGQALEWHRKYKIKQTYLTHMGTRMDYDTLCQGLPEDIRPAWDGMRIEL